MWEKFGEFDSAEEINLAAAAQLAEGDKEAILLIAKENGIDEEDAQDYIDGMAPALCTPMMAAMGKLKVEETELQPYEIMQDWLTYIQMRCTEEPDMAAAVRKKGKSLQGCIAKILVWSMKNAKLWRRILSRQQARIRGQPWVFREWPGEAADYRILPGGLK